MQYKTFYLISLLLALITAFKLSGYTSIAAHKGEFFYMLTPVMLSGHHTGVLMGAGLLFKNSLHKEVRNEGSE